MINISVFIFSQYIEICYRTKYTSWHCHDTVTKSPLWMAERCPFSSSPLVSYLWTPSCFFYLVAFGSAALEELLLGSTTSERLPISSVHFRSGAFKFAVLLYFLCTRIGASWPACLPKIFVYISLTTNSSEKR